MKSARLTACALLLLTLAGALLRAEEVTLRQSAVLKAGRSIVSLKAGTVVEVLAREGATVTIKYKDLTGNIPAARLEEPKPVAAKPAESQPAGSKPAEAKPKEDAPARPAQTTYGKAVQKAKDSAKAHDKNVVKPTDEILP